MSALARLCPMFPKNVHTLHAAKTIPVFYNPRPVRPILLYTVALQSPGHRPVCDINILRYAPIASI